MARKKQQFRHQNGFGSIVKLSGNRRKPFAVRITTGWQDGKQVRKYLGYYKSEAEALVALAEYHKNGVDLDLSKLTLNEVYDKWFDRIQKKDLSISVIRTHKMARDRFGRLGEMPIKNIKSAHLQDWMDNIDLKPSSKIKLKSTMNQVFEYATNNDIIIKNYASGLEINEKIEQVGKVFSDEELQILWDNRDVKEVQQLLILIYTGMRIGEMLDMNRNNIHFDEGYMIGGKKTEAGRDRIIPIHHKIMPFIEEQLGDNYWLIQSSRGTAKSYQNAAVKYRELFDKYGMEHKIHDTRKTFTSWMHTNGVPMESIRKIIGHSGKGVTEKVYLFKTPKELVDIVNSVEIPF